MKLFSLRKATRKATKNSYLMGGMMTLLAVLVFGIFSLSVLSSYLLNSPSLAAVISAVLVDLANADRGDNALRELAVSPVLTQAAQAKADDMAAKSYFAHVSPVDGKDSWHWFREVGYSFAYAGENLAVDFGDSGDVERAWMNSPTHRRNILDGNFTEIGIATARGTYKGHATVFVVQMFGTPARAGATAPVSASALPEEPTEPALATTEPGAPSVSEAQAVAGAAAIASGEEPAVESPAAPIEREGRTATWWEHVLASPKLMMQYGYYALAVLILLILGYVTELEFHRRHMRHVLASACLFVLMIGLFTIADAIFFAQPVIAAFVW